MTRSKVFGPSPPMMTGGWGFCTGLGWDQILSKRTNSPWNSASSFVQMSFIASTRSRSTRQRFLKSVPWFSISSAFQPPPIPKSTRPFEIRSSVATSLAVTMGSRSTTRQMPVPRRSFVVTVAAAVSATNGSQLCQYSSGRAAPPGRGLRRLAGMCVCSGNHTDSKPRSSRARAISSGRIVYSVGKITTPKSMAILRPALLEPVQLDDVVAGDLAPHARRHPAQVGVERLLGVRPDAVGVRIVRAPDDVVLAHDRDDRLQILVLLIGGVALAAEVVAGLHGEVEGARPVVVLGVQAVEDVGKPG